MEKGRRLGILALAVITAVTVGVEYPKTAARRQEAAEYQALLEAAPLAQVEGETLSPRGMQVVTAGRTDQYVSGWIVPESIQITEVPTGRVLWQMPGQLTQRAAWSPDGRFLALTHSTRTQSGLTVVDTDTWTNWDFTLPDGDSIPEYVFFPEDWAEWRDQDTLTVTLGQGDGEEVQTYRCSLAADEGGQLTGSVLEETTEVLSEDYDFDHDGVPETTELVTVGEPSGGSVAWYELHIAGGAGAADAPRPFFDGTLALQHPGWGSFIAVTKEEEDNFLMFAPVMYQGFADYRYELVSFRADGSADLLDSGGVSFDLSFGREGHQFDAEAIAGFFWKLRGILQNSTVLMSTENGEFQTGIPGLELQNYMFGDLLSLDSLEAMEAAVRQQEAEMKAEQGAI